MGSNMQRQAVPLLRARAPFVGTGMEYITAATRAPAPSRAVGHGRLRRLAAHRRPRAGEDDAVSREMGADIYPMTKFKRLQPEHLHQQKPIIRVGQKVEKGQVLADGPCTELGELALAATSSWRSCRGAATTFEDAILVSERMVKDDYLHLDSHRGVRDRVADTKLGPEEDHPRHPERVGDVPARPRRERHHPPRRVGQGHATSWWQGHAERARRSWTPERS